MGSSLSTVSAAFSTSAPDSLSTSSGEQPEATVSSPTTIVSAHRSKKTPSSSCSIESISDSEDIQGKSIEESASKTRESTSLLKLRETPIQGITKPVKTHHRRSNISKIKQKLPQPSSSTKHQSSVLFPNTTASTQLRQILSKNNHQGKITRRISASRILKKKTLISSSVSSLSHSSSPSSPSQRHSCRTQGNSIRSKDNTEETVVMSKEKPSKPSGCPKVKVSTNGKNKGDKFVTLLRSSSQGQEDAVPTKMSDARISKGSSESHPEVIDSTKTFTAKLTISPNNAASLPDYHGTTIQAPICDHSGTEQLNTSHPVKDNDDFVQNVSIEVNDAQKKVCKKKKKRKMPCSPVPLESSNVDIKADISKIGQMSEENSAALAPEMKEEVSSMASSSNESFKTSISLSSASSFSVSNASSPFHRTALAVTACCPRLPCTRNKRDVAEHGHGNNKEHGAVEKGLELKKMDHQTYSNNNNVKVERDTRPVASMAMPSARINGGRMVPPFLLPIATSFRRPFFFNSQQHQQQQEEVNEQEHQHGIFDSAGLPHPPVMNLQSSSTPRISEGLEATATTWPCLPPPPPLVLAPSAKQHHQEEHLKSMVEHMGNRVVNFDNAHHQQFLLQQHQQQQQQHMMMMLLHQQQQHQLLPSSMMHQQEHLLPNPSPVTVEKTSVVLGSKNEGLMLDASPIRSSVHQMVNMIPTVLGNSSTSNHQYQQQHACADQVPPDTDGTMNRATILGIEPCFYEASRENESADFVSRCASASTSTSPGENNQQELWQQQQRRNCQHKVASHERQKITVSPISSSSLSSAATQLLTEGYEGDQTQTPSLTNTPTDAPTSSRAQAPPLPSKDIAKDRSFTTKTTTSAARRGRSTKKSNKSTKEARVGRGGPKNIITSKRRGASDRDTKFKNTEEEGKASRGAQQASSPIPTAQSRPNGSASTDDDDSSSTSRSRDSSPPPTVRYIHGKKVTMIDEEKKVFVVDLMTPETCDFVRKLVDDHIRDVNESGSGQATWRTLYTYTKMDLPVTEVPGLPERVTSKIMDSVKKIVGEVFQEKKEAMKLRPRSWKEPHLLLYQRVPDKP